MTSEIEYEAIESLMDACGLTEEDMIQKIEITQAGVLVTLAFQVEGKAFTVGEGDQQSPLVFYRAFAITRPDAVETDEHTHEDGTTHVHEDVLVDTSVTGE